MSKTLGQVAYEAWHLEHMSPGLSAPYNWNNEYPDGREAWQAAAEAVARVAWAEGCCAGAYAQEDLQQDVDDLVNPYEALQAELRDEG